MVQVGHGSDAESWLAHGHIGLAAQAVPAKALPFDVG